MQPGDRLSQDVLPDWLNAGVLTALFTPARSSLFSIYLFPLPAGRFCLA